MSKLMKGDEVYEVQGKHIPVRWYNTNYKVTALIRNVMAGQLLKF
jgi:hypothetical protein